MKKERWSGPGTVKEVVYDAVIEYTSGDANVKFEPKEIVELVLMKHPTFNPRTVRCQLSAACPNHRSYHHHPSVKERYYWLIEDGVYRLYNPETDGK